MSTPEPTKVYRRRLDFASLALLLVALIGGTTVAVLLAVRSVPLLYAPFLLGPSVISASIALRHITKTEAVIG